MRSRIYSFARKPKAPSRISRIDDAVFARALCASIHVGVNLERASLRSFTGTSPPSPSPPTHKHRRRGGATIYNSLPPPTPEHKHRCRFFFGTSPPSPSPPTHKHRRRGGDPIYQSLPPPLPRTNIAAGEGPYCKWLPSVKALLSSRRRGGCRFELPIGLPRYWPAPSST